MPIPSHRRMLLAAALALVSSACRTGEGKFQELSIPALAELQQQNAVKIYDVNTDDFRAEYGKIPGAILLDSSRNYDLGLLPEQRADKIAFYCTSRL